MSTDLDKFETVGKYPSWFNKDQEQALDKMIDFSFSDKRTKFVLEGAAGTGKTTIIKEFKKHCKARSGFCVAAPTHKAVRVVSKATGIEGFTIQKLLGLRPNFNLDNFDPRNIQFDLFGKKNIELYNTLVVDEASMIPSKLCKYLDDECAKHNVKLIYTGDPYQLPPVKESFSPAFRVPMSDKAVLRQVMRQGDDNPLSDFLMDIRKAIDKSNYDYINKLYGKRFLKGGKGFMHVDLETFQSYSTKAFNNDSFKADINWAKLVTYTNANVSVWNKFIRDSMFPEHSQEPLIIHDLFTCYNTIVDEFNVPKITNSEEYIINDFHSFRNRHGIEGWMVKLQEVATGNFTPYLFIVNHTDSANWIRTTTTLLKLISDASSVTISPGMRAKKWKEYYEFKDENLLMVDVKDPMNPKKIAVSKDLDYGYAITSHKSQGSTYDHVFCNLQNIFYGDGNSILNNANMVNRMFYVAASRAKETLSILY